MGLFDLMEGEFSGLTFPLGLYDAIIAHARSVFPEECCGLVAGPAGGGPIRVIPMENALHSPVRYEMNPKEQFQVQKNLRREGLEMWAIYHSHPVTRPYPSETDIRLAFYPELYYLLTSLAEDPPPLKAYTIQNGVVREIPLRVLPGEA
ncbi:Mov34/MPN/PAD-1 family protein [Leptospirillum ferriphilum]|uniref:Mov34/MPN/PAD-1 family protein n=3 Tax=Leptospirillum TaxID=179 RepID=A0A094WD80_9BACT|nr:Mov34/MPN/PAD-1 family protein [Leptospirillum ferriphilum]